MVGYLWLAPDRLGSQSPDEPREWKHLGMNGPHGGLLATGLPGHLGSVPISFVVTGSLHCCLIPAPTPPLASWGSCDMFVPFFLPSLPLPTLPFTLPSSSSSPTNSLLCPYLLPSPLLPHLSPLPSPPSSPFPSPSVSGSAITANQIPEPLTKLLAALPVQWEINRAGQLAF